MIQLGSERVEKENLERAHLSQIDPKVCPFLPSGKCQFDVNAKVAQRHTPGVEKRYGAE